jgi:hypothetical protein
MPNWPDNDVWEPRDAFNRAPRPALIECEPLRNRRCVHVMHGLLKFVAVSAFIAIVTVALVYYAR